MNRLFVYGIFLDESNRIAYGMSDPYYATVEDYATFGGKIVAAYELKGTTLTGLVVDVDPSRWPDIDRLEAGYNRIKVKTTDGVECWMYIGKY